MMGSAGEAATNSFAKMNIIVQLEFELTYFEATAKHFNLYTLPTTWY